MRVTYVFFLSQFVQTKTMYDWTAFLKNQYQSNLHSKYTRIDYMVELLSSLEIVRRRGRAWRELVVVLEVFRASKHPSL